MKFNSVFVFTSALFVTLISNVSGAALDVFVPPITSPKAGDVWTSGQTQLVTWYVSLKLHVHHIFLSNTSIDAEFGTGRDTSKAPVNITNKLGLIFLRKSGTTTPC